MRKVGGETHAELRDAGSDLLKASGVLLVTIESSLGRITPGTHRHLEELPNQWSLLVDVGSS